jgi:REP-associated tyrosine transposase
VPTFTRLCDVAIPCEFSEHNRFVAKKTRGTIHAGIYHVTRRSAGPIAMYRDDYDRTYFCNLLARVSRRFDWICHAFVLMTTHYHLLVEVEENLLQPGMHSLNGRYAQEFNRRHGRKGHLRGGPYDAKEITDEAQLLTTARYIARNPVKAEICRDPAEWPWSSYRGAIVDGQGFPFVTNELLLTTFNEERAKAQRLLRVFVETE